jgi:ribonuclease PH
MNAIALGLASAGICMSDLLVSCTAAVHSGNCMLDTNEEEEYDTDNELVVSYISNESRIDFLELRNAKVKEDELKKVYGIAKKGCAELHSKIRRSLMDYARKKLLVF